MKVAVYTAIFGGKDTIRSPISYNFDADVDYFLITDDKQLKSDIYKIVLKEAIYTDIAKNARFYKILGLERFENYDYVIWHDANMQIVQLCIRDLINSVQYTQIAAFKHPKRNNFYDEAIACIKDKKEEPLILFYQCLVYFIKNYSPYSGLYETGILVRKMNNCNKDFFQDWWSHVKHYSRRDQISFPVMVNKYAISINFLEGEGLKSPYAIYYGHRYNKYITGNKTKALPIFFKKLIVKIIPILKMLSKKINE